MIYLYFGIGLLLTALIFYISLAVEGKGYITLEDICYGVVIAAFNILVWPLVIAFIFCLIISDTDYKDLVIFRYKHAKFKKGQVLHSKITKQFFVIEKVHATKYATFYYDGKLNGKSVQWMHEDVLLSKEFKKSKLNFANALFG